MRKMHKLIITLLLILTPVCCLAKETSTKPLPKFIWLRANEVNLRKGPNVNYPIIWTYKHKGYPMQVIDKFENWYKLKDLDGTEGWMNAALTTTTLKNAIVIDAAILENERIKPSKKDELILFRSPNEYSVPLVKLKIGVIVRAQKCCNGWCSVKVENYKGWIREVNLWGIE